LDSVTVTTTSGSPASPAAKTAPRPSGPATPNPWASSTRRTAPCSLQAACSSRRGAVSPSTEKSDSTTTRARSSARFASSLATASGSLCGVTATRARDSRAPSMIEAWFSASDTIRSPRPASAVRTPTFARYPEENTRADSAPAKAARASSRSVWSSVVPVTRRDPVEPAPQASRAATAPATTSGCRVSPR
jgi:hypothetical protein